MKNRLVVMLEIETSDPRLSPHALADFGSVRTVAAARAAVMLAVPGDVTRVVAILPVLEAQMIMMLHEAVGKELGAQPASRPPANYVPPTRE